MEKIGYSLYLNERVEELLREGTLQEVIKLIEADLQDEWKRTPPADSQTRELIYHEIHALNRLDIKLQTLVDNLAMSKRS